LQGLCPGIFLQIKPVAIIWNCPLETTSSNGKVSKACNEHLSFKVQRYQ